MGNKSAAPRIVLVDQNCPPSIESFLEEAGWEPRRMQLERLDRECASLKIATALVSMSNDLLCKTDTSQAPNLRFLCSIGRQDTGAPAHRGLLFINKYSEVNSRAHAEVIFTEILGRLLRRSPEGQFLGQTVGLLGYDGVLTIVGILCEAVGLRISFYDEQERLRYGSARQLQDVALLSRESDLVVFDSSNTRGVDIGFLGTLRSTRDFVDINRDLQDAVSLDSGGHSGQRCARELRALASALTIAYDEMSVISLEVGNV